MPKLMIRGGDLDLVEYELQPFLPGNQMNTLDFEKKKYSLKPVKGTVVVTAPARIHLTVLDMNRFAPGKPGGGGVGFAVQVYCTAEVSCTPKNVEINYDRYGQETYWKGVLGHDLEPGRAYEEVSRTAHELRRIGQQIVDYKRTNQVAILYSDDSYYGIEFMRFSARVNYRTILQQMYRVLYRNNVGVDFVFPESRNFSDYKVILVPPLYVASDAVLKNLVDYVRGGGHVVMAFKSGFTNEYNTVRWTIMPGILREAAGFHYQEFSNLRQPLALKGDPFRAGSENKVSDWAEMLNLDSAEGVAYYDHPFFGRYPAITRNRFGNGSLTYEGTVLTDALQEKVLLEVFQRAAVTGPDQTLPPNVRTKHGVNRNGRTIHYYLNYSSDARTFSYPYGSGTNLLTQAAVTHSQQITVKPWDLVLVEEK